MEQETGLAWIYVERQFGKTGLPAQSSILVCTIFALSLGANMRVLGASAIRSIDGKKQAEREKDDGKRAEAALAFPGEAPAQKCYYYSAKWAKH